MPGTRLSFLAWAVLAAAGPILPRTVTSLDAAAVAEAQQRDGTATRALSNTQIKTSDGRCLLVDELSGDFRENLTPIQVGACGATAGQGWDIITAGKHINVANSMLIVSTLTQACANFDPRRAAGNQVLLFSCGGRADGSGAVTNSQLFTFNGTTAAPLALKPENAAGSCFVVKGNVIDIAACNPADPNQSFSFVGSNTGGSSIAASTGATTLSGSGMTMTSNSVATIATAATAASSMQGTTATPARACTRRTRTVTVTMTGDETVTASSSTVSASSSVASAGSSASTTLVSTGSTSRSGSGSGSGSSSVGTSTNSTTSSTTSRTRSRSTSTTSSAAETSLANAGGAAVVSGNITTALPTSTSAVPVSRGGNLNPTAAAEANQRDSTATRAFSDVAIRAPNGQCISIDPTAGDFRENLIPIGLVDCNGTPNQKWDVITQGIHDNRDNSALIVNTLVQGCISFDGRRATNDTVTLFSCGGRADGTGQTQADQLFPFIGELSFPLAPEGENTKTCILAGDDNTRLISGACPTDGSELFSIVPNV